MEDKIYFQPGELVTLRQPLEHRPVMIVVRKESTMIRRKDDKADNGLRGIRCRWFSTDKKLQEAVFNTKDLQKIQ